MTQASSSQSGNVLFYVLIGIVMFALLAVVVKRSMHDSNQNMVSDEQMYMAASEMVDYAESIKTAVLRLIASGRCVDTQISFENDVYLQKGGDKLQPITTGPTATLKRCRIFDSAGGGLTPAFPAQEYFPYVTAVGATPRDGHPHLILAQLPQVGIWPDSPELVLKIPGVPTDLCRAINRKAGIEGAGGNFLPVDPDTGSVLFSGTYTLTGTNGILGNDDTTLVGKGNFCAKATAGSTQDAAYYHLILPR